MISSLLYIDRFSRYCYIKSSIRQLRDRCSTNDDSTNDLTNADSWLDKDWIELTLDLTRSPVDGNSASSLFNSLRLCCSRRKN